MEKGSLQGFIDNAMRTLSEVRIPLRAFRNREVDSIPAAEISQSLDAVHFAAVELGLDEIAAAAKDGIGAVFAAGEENGDRIRPFELISRLETLLLRKSLEDDYLALDMEVPGSEVPLVGPDEMDQFEFSATEFKGPSEDEGSIHASDHVETFPDGAAELEGFEIDDELLEIFAGEAEELLQNIENSLSALAANPNDKDSLWEIRRNAHTFKGSAGIVGLKQISELAHRVEDLLDRLAESSSDSNASILNILRASFDCLKALTAGEKSPTLFHRISQLYYDFDGVLAGLEIREDASPTEIPPTFTQGDAVPQPLPVSEIGSFDSIHVKAFALPTEPAQPVKTSSSRSVVRVSLDRLDELVGIARDMIIGRSAFEQRLRELERQIEELHNTTRRLQTTSTKLEVDFEASMLNSERPFLSGTSVFSEYGTFGPKNGFDELEFDKYTEFHQSTRELAEVTSDTFAINTALDVLRGNLETLFEDQRRLIEDLHDKLMRIRMVEFGSLSTRLQRAVRVTCEEEKKLAEVSIENEAADIDTQILDTLVEPLMHLLKNAVVHGIEFPETREAAGKPRSGMIRVKVSNEETHIIVKVTDDGRGIDPRAVVDKAVSLGLVDAEASRSISDEEALNMIFLPGLSTAEKLNLSAGRGVGMSIVKESIEAQNGSITTESTRGIGATFVIRLPLPLAVTSVLIVNCGSQIYAIPRKHAIQIVEVEGSKIPDAVEIGGATYPLFTMTGPQVHNTSGVGEPKNAVVIRAPEREFALLVDGIRGTEEVVIKPLGQPLDRIKGILGAAILGNGDLVPIVDLSVVVGDLERKEAIVDPPAPTPVPEALTIMVVDDSPSVRHMTSKVVAGAGWKVITAKDGLDAIEQLRLLTAMPAVILSDIEMPRMDGYELAAALQRAEGFRSIPVVMITSRSAEKHRDKAFESGVTKYLTKPYDDKELLETIRTLANIT